MQLKMLMMLKDPIVDQLVEEVGKLRIKIN